MYEMNNENNMKRLICYVMLFVGAWCGGAWLDLSAQTEVMAWGNVSGIRVDGELMDFETAVLVGDRITGRERYGTTYERQGDMQQVKTSVERVGFVEQVTDLGRGRCRIHLELTSDTTRDVPAGICLRLDGVKYAGAKVKTGGRQVSVRLTDDDGNLIRDIRLALSRTAKASVTRSEREIRVVIPVMARLTRGSTASMDIDVTATGSIDHGDATVTVDSEHPGRLFLGVGGNFRLQNPRTDPAVIDYCLNNIRVAYGRVEMPWRQWQPEEDTSLMDLQPEALPKHVRESMAMAQRLARQGMPVIVSCWFPPVWAVEDGSLRPRRPGVAALRLDAAKQQRIVASLADYLVYLKNHYGVEAAMFSFNESDIGIDVLHTPEEHATFIKDMGRELVGRGLATKMLLGDTSDATPTDFIVPAMNDRDALPYIGAISFHSWRGCDDSTLRVWAEAAERLGVPLLVGEGSTDAAAWRYPQIFKESTFALYEINLYVRLCAICQPLSILQWQLTADYSLLWGGGIFGSQGALVPTQRFWNIRQLASTPQGSFALPVTSSKPTLNCAAFGNSATGASCIHLVNNGAACRTTIDGLPGGLRTAIVYVTNAVDGMKESMVPIEGGRLTVDLPPVSFVTVLASVTSEERRRKAPSVVQVPVEHDWLWVGDTPYVLHAEVTNTMLEEDDISLKVLYDIGLMTKPVTALETTAHVRFVEGKATAAFDISSLAPGFYQVSVGGGEPFNIGIRPEEIISPQDKQPDFDDFWNNTLGELAEVEPDYRLTLMPDHSNAQRNVYRVECRSLGGALMGGYYCEPVKEGKYPAKIEYMGYGAEPYIFDPSSEPETIQFLVSVRGQGIFLGSTPRNWDVQGLANRDSYYYRGAFADVVRAINFIASREKCDTNRIYAQGESQGGAFTWVAAALDNRIAAAAPSVPFLGDFPHYAQIVNWPMGEILAAAHNQGIAEDDLYRMLSYFDTKNFTDKIKCPLYMSFGLQDNTCPPHTEFAAYNQVRSPKAYFCVPLCGHAMWQQDSWTKERARWFDAM